MYLERFVSFIRIMDKVSFAKLGSSEVNKIVKLNDIISSSLLI